MMSGGPRATNEIRPLWLLGAVAQLIRRAESAPRAFALPAPESDYERQLLKYLSTGVFTDAWDAPALSSDAADPYADKISAVLRDIHLHYNRPQRAADLARTHGLSLSLLRKRFRASTGCTIHEYTTLVRVYNGVLALTSTDEKVAAVARRVGYSSKKDFYKALRDHVGALPTDIRSSSLSHQHDVALAIAEKLLPEATTLVDEVESLAAHF